MAGQDCQFDPSLVRTLSYQGIADAFGQLLQGTVGLRGHDLPYPEVTYNSNIAKTVLLDTNELSFLQTWKMDGALFDLAAIEQVSNGTDYVGLSNTPNVTSRGPLAKALEDLFQNITLSMLSEQYLQPNYSSPYAPSAMENVTFTSYHNIYVYDGHTLWIAYGLAIAFTTSAVAIGLAAIMLTGASYNNNFSTVLRVSKSTSMSEVIHEDEGDGSEPLPKHLAKARVLITKAGETQTGEPYPEKNSVASSVTFIDEPQATAQSSLLRADSRRTV